MSGRGYTAESMSRPVVRVNRGLCVSHVGGFSDAVGRDAVGVSYTDFDSAQLLPQQKVILQLCDSSTPLVSQLARNAYVVQPVIPPEVPDNHRELTHEELEVYRKRVEACALSERGVVLNEELKDDVKMGQSVKLNTLVEEAQHGLKKVVEDYFTQQ